MTKLATARTTAGITQEALAQRLGFTPQTVSYHEKRGIYDTRTAHTFAAALACTIEDILEFPTTTTAND